MNFPQFLSAALFPERCPLCHKLIPLQNEICSCITDSVSLISDEACIHCAHNLSDCVCRSVWSIPLSHCAAVYLYTGKIKFQIAQLKYSGKKSLAVSFAYSMAEKTLNAFPNVEFDGICFVPSSEEAMQKRGFNQSELIACKISQLLDIPLLDLLVKTKDTEAQHNLPAKKRLFNLVNSIEFKGDADIKGKVILLCDDVKTTGATLKECEKVLFKNGAQDVFSIVAAVSDFRI